MGKTRLEAFSDGVIAILITIMVLELKAPAGTEAASWKTFFEGDRAAVLMAYVLSFIYLAIYWNNHHHMFAMVKTVNGAILWANLHLLFWLSLVPVVTAWVGQHGLDTAPTALYGIIFLAAAIAYYILQTVIVRHQGRDSALKDAIGGDAKGKVSPLLYAAAIGLAFVRPWLSQTIYVIVALIWLVPDRRIESRMAGRSEV